MSLQVSRAGHPTEDPILKASVVFSCRALACATCQERGRTLVRHLYSLQSLLSVVMQTIASDQKVEEMRLWALVCGGSWHWGSHVPAGSSAERARTLSCPVSLILSVLWLAHAMVASHLKNHILSTFPTTLKQTRPVVESQAPCSTGSEKSKVALLEIKHGQR
eukprot:2336410-Amphidinium_carterae.2